MTLAATRIASVSGPCLRGLVAQPLSGLMALRGDRRRESISSGVLVQWQMLRVLSS